MKLYEFEHKNVRIKRKDGTMIEGFVEVYFCAEDDETGEEGICLTPNKRDMEGIGLYASEIEEIVETPRARESR